MVLASDLDGPHHLWIAPSGYDAVDAAFEIA